MNLTRIDFPGYVQNTSKAIDLLGGVNGIHQTLNKENPSFSFSFRDNDPLSHPISSTEVNDPCVLIRIKVVRKFKKIKGILKLISTDLIPEFVGKSRTTHVFKGPSDFQFLPALDSPLNQKTVDYCPQMNFMYIPPKVFVHNYKYDAAYIQKRIFASQQHEKTKTWNKQDCPWIVNQNDLMTVEMETGPRPIAPARDVTEGLLSIFEELFTERPIWTTIALLDRIAESHETRGGINDLSEQHPSIFHTLACVSYYIKDGPFKMCWCRYGINPIQNEKYRLYQSIGISLKHWDYAEVVLKKSNRSGTRYIPKTVSNLPIGISKLNAVPDRLFFSIQLIDVKDDIIVEALNEPEKKYTFKSGWYSEAILDNIRKYAILKLSRMVNNENERPPEIIMKDILSFSQIDKALQETRPKKNQKLKLDFEFMNNAQAILGSYSETQSQETTMELMEIMNKKFCTRTIADCVFNI